MYMCEICNMNVWNNYDYLQIPHQTKKVTGLQAKSQKKFSRAEDQSSGLQDC